MVMDYNTAYFAKRRSFIFRVAVYFSRVCLLTKGCTSKMIMVSSPPHWQLIHSFACSLCARRSAHERCQADRYIFVLNVAIR